MNERKPAQAINGELSLDQLDAAAGGLTVGPITIESKASWASSSAPAASVAGLAVRASLIAQSRLACMPSDPGRAGFL
ncbi:MAG: hypothetical protein H0V72_26370 [Bradyrhizobium sp.]|nr:hypothetical protein [Bradyrhizobium sp.]